MAFYVDERGNITLIQGDSGSLVIKGLDTQKNYTVYFAVQNKKREPVGNEIYVSSNMQSSVTFRLTGDFTDLLTVDKNSNSEIYYYGIKACSSVDNTEDTLILGNGSLGDLNTITVFPKKVEGTLYE